MTDHYGALTNICGIVLKMDKRVSYYRKTNLTENEWHSFNDDLKSCVNDNVSCLDNVNANEHAVCTCPY